VVINGLSTTATVIVPVLPPALPEELELQAPSASAAIETAVATWTARFRLRGTGMSLDRVAAAFIDRSSQMSSAESQVMAH
jgi:hypothetical protein